MSSPGYTKATIYQANNSQSENTRYAFNSSNGSFSASTLPERFRFLGVVVNWANAQAGVADPDLFVRLYDGQGGSTDPFAIFDFTSPAQDFAVGGQFSYILKNSYFQIENGLAYEFEMSTSPGPEDYLTFTVYYQ